MKDRSVEYPNRYRMTLVPGTTDIYEMTPVPGEVYEEGTLMSKGNILDDNSEMDIWGTIGDRTPNDAFSFIGKSLSEHDEDIANLAATLEGKIVTGTYTGNGGTKTIDLGATPKMVIVSYYGEFNTNDTAGMAITGMNSSGSYYTVSIVENGFMVVAKKPEYGGFNNNGSLCMYVAVL